ncbi:MULTISPECIES: hypothetical protein [unclassified Micromonospora]|uniref:hypothetical protein n=1 Tax=unclassified Micromonospora TaxID=2617518 RepID=UPI0033229FF0
MTIDDERVTDLLRRLDEEPAGLPRIDVPGAIREARRRRRNRRAAVAGAAALGVLAAAALPGILHGRDRAAPAPAVSPSLPSPKPRPTGPWEGVCTAELLPVPDDALGSVVTGGDPDGRWLVGRQIPRNLRNYRLLIWHEGRVRAVELPGEEQELQDVNRSGLAVGSARPTRGLPEALAVRDGQPVRLPGIGSGAATAVNDAGRIVGWRDVESVGPWPATRPVVWDSYDSQAVDLPLPGPAWYGSAVDIDEDGTVLADMADMAGAVDPGRPRRAVVWRPGATRPEVLPLPRVPGGDTVQFTPLSLAGGWVTGMAWREKQPGEPRNALQEYPVRIDLRTGQAELLPATVWAGTGNARGWQAGTSSGNNLTAVVTDTKMVKLPGLDGTTASGSGWVRSLSDDGRVVAGQLYLDNTGRAVRWTCR